MFIKIAVIDSGICKDKLPVDAIIWPQGMYIISEGNIIKQESKISHLHGTYIAGTILAMCPTATILDYNILDENLRSDGRILIKTLTDALNQGVDIINMSLGTIENRYRLQLYSIVKRARKKNIYLVASHSNDASKVYPASFRNVISVDVRSKRVVKGFTLHDSLVTGHPYLFDGDNYVLSHDVCGNSYATAQVTGIIAQILDTRKRG